MTQTPVLQTSHLTWHSSALWPIDLTIIKVADLHPSGGVWTELGVGVTITDMVVLMVVVAVVVVGVEEQVEEEEEAIKARVVPTWGPLGT